MTIFRDSNKNEYLLTFFLYLIDEKRTRFKGHVKKSPEKKNERSRQTNISERMKKKKN